MSKEDDHSTPREIFTQESAHARALQRGLINEHPNARVTHRTGYEDYLEKVHDGALTHTELLEITVNKLSRHLTEDRGDISRPPDIVIDQSAMHAIFMKIVVEDGFIREYAKRKLVGYEEQGSRNPLMNLFAAELVNLNRSKPQGMKLEITRSKVTNAASAFLTHLFWEKERPSKKEIPEKKFDEILNFDILNEAMILAAFEEDEASVSSQLLIERQFELARNGLIITPEKNGHKHEEMGFDLPLRLITILDFLKHSESATVLKDWINEQIQEDAFHCVNLLRTLAQFTSFLDSETYFQLYFSESGNVPLLPFRSLLEGIDQAITYLEKLGPNSGYEHSIAELNKTREIVISRFHRVLAGPLQDEIEVAPESLTPLVDDLVTNFSRWAIPLLKKGMPMQDAAQHALALLRQVGIEDVKEFCTKLASVSILEQEFDGLHEVLIQSILKESVRENMTPDQKNEYSEQLYVETLTNLESNPWTDIADIDLSKIIDPDTQTLEFYLGRGTYGPWTFTGHGNALTKVQALIEHKNQRDLNPETRSKSRQGKTQRFILITPHIFALHKPLGVPGSIEDRIKAIILQTQSVDKTNVFMTTQLQPIQEEAADSATAMSHIRTMLYRQLAENYKGQGLVKPDIIMIPFYGPDELKFNDKNGRLQNIEQQNEKFRKGGRCVIVGRHGFLLRIINNADAIGNMIDADFVLTPGYPGASSSETRERLRLSGNAPMITLPALPFVHEVWNPKAIQDRRVALEQKMARVKEAGEEEPIQIPSVTQIHQDLVREYRTMMEDMRIRIS